LLVGCAKQKVQTSKQEKVQDSNSAEGTISYIGTQDPCHKYFFYKIHPTLQSFRFDLFADSTFKVVDSVRISKGNDTSQIQTIIGKLTDQPFITFKDYDFDEYEDVVLSGGHGAHGNMNYDIWLYDTVTCKFRNNVEMSELVNPDVDYENETILSSGSGGRNFHSYYTYKLIAGHLVLISEEKEFPIVNTNTAIKIVCKLHNGRMDTVKIDSVKMED
jgi:hypothetical protein